MQLITRFNSMIRSRLLWAIFAIIISISFVGAFSMRGAGDESRKGSAEGTLFNRDVSPNEYNLARFFALGMRDSGSLSDEERGQLREATWQRLAMLQMAHDLQIYVSDEELFKVIQKDPSFASESGGFDKNRYKMVLQSYYRVNRETYEAFLRQQITINMLSTLLESAAWTAPTDLALQLSDFSDAFTVEYALVQQTNVVKASTVTSADALRFYKDHQALFTIPVKRNVRYVAFESSNYLAKVTVTDPHIREYYEEHADEFQRTIGTNATPETIPLEDARADIEETLKKRMSLRQAKEDATDLVIAMSEGRYGRKGLSLEAAAKRWNVTIQTSRYFTVTEDLSDMQANEQFAKAAFSLDPKDSQRSFSDAIICDSRAYVLASGSTQAERIPEFSEVADQVMPLVESNALQVAFVERSSEICETVKQDISEGKSFNNSIATLDLGVNVATTRPFSVYEARLQGYYGAADSNRIDYANELAAGIKSLGKGELAEPLSTDDGMLLAYVADRQPSDLSTTDFLRQGLAKELARAQAAEVAAAWGSYLLKQANFQDFHPIAPATDSDDDSTDDTTAVN